MSKIKDKLIEVEDLIVQGLDADTVAKIAGVPVDWVIDVELEMRGLHQYGYEEEYGEPYYY